MNQKQTDLESTASLRTRAEDRLQKGGTSSHGALQSWTQEEAQRTIHELEVHQLELVMQNEELSRLQADLEDARAHYFDLYHLAPIGYCILSREGLVMEANLTAVKLLDLALATLVKKPITQFIYKDDQDLYYLHRKQLHRSDQLSSCELRMVKRDGTLFWAQLISAPPEARPGPGGAGETRLILSDISERRSMQEEKADLLARLQQAQIPAG
ncbi:MAG: PAS domain-containing protein [Acidobacteria bacterium]|nr:PAS domain-containing protein [Acidobacteriota bacterium]MBI3487220.1 PAS domain-containing protein [Acidobacteriota bacterium]